MYEFPILDYLDLAYRNTFIVDDKKGIIKITSDSELFKAIDPSFILQMQSLVKDVEVDFDVPLLQEDE